MRIAVTGGAGFVGRALINQLAHRGDTVTALIRNLRKFENPWGVTVVEGSLEDQAALARLCDSADIVINLAGVTHARRDEEFYAINVDGAVRVAKAAANAGALFIHISSLSARRPEVSPYADSKRTSEAAIAEACGASPSLSLRLPAIYGPGDYVTLPYFKLVKSGLALEPKTVPAARASILFVEDAAAAVLAAADAAPGKVYEVGDEQSDGHSWGEIGQTLADALNVRAKAIKAPRPLVASYHKVLLGSARLMGRVSSVRKGQINEFFHPDWVARNGLLNEAIGWRPQTPLKEGFAKTARWYQENGLL